MAHHSRRCRQGQAFDLGPGVWPYLWHTNVIPQNGAVWYEEEVSHARNISGVSNPVPRRL
jgi:hypothetical protein